MAEGLRRVNVEESLMAAAEEGDIEGLYVSLKEDPAVLDRIDAIAFVETPLHAAASAGQELFAKEILRLKPSFGPKLNPDGLSSLHLALINRKFDMVKILINLNRQLIRVKGKEGETPLHLIVKNEDIDHVEADQQQIAEGRITSSQEQRVDGSSNGGQQRREDPRILILAELLFACPNSIEDRTIRDETALHIAVKNKNIDAVEVILGFIHRTYTTWVPAARDFEGNTVLHMAVSNSQLKMVKLIVKEFTGDEINIQNYVAKKTALDIALLLQTDEASSIERSLRDAGAKPSSPSVNEYSLPKFLSSPEQHDEVLYKKDWFAKRDTTSMEQRTNLGLVVAVLIATTTFQAVLSPPGGVGSGNDQLLRNGSYVSAIVSSSNHPFAAANTSFINATLFTPTHVDGESGALSRFYFLNTAAFSFSVVMIMVFLSDAHFLPLHCALVVLTFGYLTSFLLVTTSSNLPMMYYVINIVILLSVVLVYIYKLFWQQRNQFSTTASMGDDERFRMLGNLLRNYI